MTDSTWRRARFLVLESLYEAETSSHDPEAVYNRRITEVAEEDPELAAPGPSGFGRGVLRGVLRKRDELDEYISFAAPKYAVNTLPVVDRNILRLAIWELLSDNSAPVAAVVNEAVELAHRYGGETSPAFVNGVLRTVSKRIREESPESTHPEQPNPKPDHQEN
ncbi:MAG TPA: transcription antitermination factor NusB [Tepidiformaceae bacterium]|nr:transcription antitermination factor NusB [Tepidiformaceae bacterium]